MQRLLLTTDRPPYVEIMTRVGLAPDPWQREVLDSDHPQMLLNCSRQAGKSTVVAMFKVRQANNSLRPGIAAVSSRLRDGTLRVLKGRCPNLLAEAGLYTYGETSKDRQGEKPLDDHNHALDALRYLIHKIDAHRRVRGAGEAA